MVSTPPTQDMDRIAQFQRLMRLGHVTYAEGNRRQAHRFWRRAAMLNPTDEQVWLALLNVLDNDEDRRVCLQNIVAINPNNLQAQQKLNRYEDATHPATTLKPIVKPLPLEPESPIRRLMLRLVEVALLSILLVVGITALQYLLFVLR